MSEHVIETETRNGALFIPYQAKLSEAVREEIVRCRDCKHMSRDMSTKFCYRPPAYHEFAVEPDGFCKWGERKEGDA